MRESGLSAPLAEPGAAKQDTVSKAPVSGNLGRQSSTVEQEETKQRRGQDLLSHERPVK